MMFLFCLLAQMVFLSPPEEFKPKVEAAGCFIFVEDRVLFLKRQPFIVHGNTWGVPGGKVEKGESAEEAVLREVREETGLEINGVKTLDKTYIRSPKGDFIYSMFEARLDGVPEVVLDPKEHSEYCWVTLQEALAMPLIPGEDECIELTYSLSQKD